MTDGETTKPGEQRVDEQCLSRAIHMTTVVIHIWPHSLGVTEHHERARSLIRLVISVIWL
jgi:hypothetical protein